MKKIWKKKEQKAQSGAEPEKEEEKKEPQEPQKAEYSFSKDIYNLVVKVMEVVALGQVFCIVRRRGI